MNEAAREALRAAALAGVPQLYGKLHDRSGGRCAVGVLIDAGLEGHLYHRPIRACHLCGATRMSGRGGALLDILHEERLMAHLNNDHKLDFIGIAEKMPQEAV